MKGLWQTIGVLSFFGLLAIAVYFLGLNQKSETRPNTDYAGEVFDPFELSKNPYRAKGHFGVLDTTRNWIRTEAGQRILVPHYGPCLKFEKMVDEHTAIFNILCGSRELFSQPQLAVELENSSPPDPSLPWRVYVEGAEVGENGFGAKFTVAKVRFDGYGMLPAKSIEQPSPTLLSASATETQPAESPVIQQSEPEDASPKETPPPVEVSPQESLAPEQPESPPQR